MQADEFDEEAFVRALSSVRALMIGRPYATGLGIVMPSIDDLILTKRFGARKREGALRVRQAGSREVLLAR